MDADTRTVLRDGGWGLLGGTAAGLIALPLTGGGARSVFIGSSVGLYIGLIAGFYHIYTKDDADSPFRAEREELQPWENPSPFRVRKVADVEIPILRFQ